MARRPPWQHDDAGLPAPGASASARVSGIPVPDAGTGLQRVAVCWSARDVAAVLGSSLFATLVFTVVLRRQLLYYLPGATTRPPWGNDYPVHAYIAQQWMNTGQPGVPHFLYELLSIVLHSMSLSLLTAGQVVAIFSFALSGVLVYSLIRFPPIPDARTVDPPVAALLVVGVQLLAPIVFFTLPYRNLYLGYVPTTVYHNPTIVLLRPLALLLALQALWIFEPKLGRRLWATASATALLVLLATLAKPSYTICLLPGLALFCVWRAVRGQSVDWRLAGAGFFVPLLLVLGVQYVMQYQHGPSATRIQIAPFYFFREILRLFGKPAWLAPKLALSILFPLTVFLLYVREATRSVLVMLSWTVFGIGALYTYFIVEGGQGSLDGNFTWSGQISLYVLFVMSLAFFISQGGFRRFTPRSVVCAGVFGLHVVSGMIWAYRQASPEANQWW